MNRRYRTVAGMLALVAMIGSLAEAVAASMCASPLEMAAMSDVVMSEEISEEGGASDEDGWSCARQATDDEPSQHGERCPLTPAASQGCSAVASLPAPAISVGAPLPQSVRALTVVVPKRDFLLPDALYHPPRA